MTQRIKDKIKSEIHIMKKEITLPEYIFWWLCRGIMIYVVITTYIQESSGHFDLQMRANTVFLFILPVLHMLPRKYTFLARLHHRVQTIVCFMVITTSFLGNYIDLYGVWGNYDTFIHFVAGVVCVPVGYYLLLAFSTEEEKHSPLAKTVAGFGLSCFASLVWECYEYIFDWIASASTQGWGETPNAAFIEKYPTDPLRYPLFDTMSDALAGLTGAVITGMAMRVILETKEHRERRKTDNEINFSLQNK